MKCPLQIGLRYRRWWFPVKIRRDCLQKECAWWHQGLEACSVYLIQEQLALVFGYLQKIEEKMPHAEQLTK